MGSGRATGVALGGGLLLLVVGFLLGRWTADPGVRRDEPKGGASATGRDSTGHADAPASPGVTSPGGKGAEPVGNSPSAVNASGPAPADEPHRAPDSGDEDPATEARAGTTRGRSKTDLATDPATGEPATPPGVPVARRDPHGPGRAEPPPPYALPKTIRGRVFDAATRRPIPGVGLFLAMETSDGTRSAGADIVVAEDGSFELKANEVAQGFAEEVFKERQTEGRNPFESAEAALADLDFTLKASAKGYEITEVPDPGPEEQVGMEAERFDAFLGSIRVDARWPDGVRFAGRLLVSIWGEGREWSNQWALPDPDGSFLFPGVAPGRCRIRVGGKHDSGREVVVPESGEVMVRLRVSRKGVEDPPGTPQGEPREVAVSCGSRPVGPGSFVRAEIPYGAFFRSEVVAGIARFAALPAGEWTFVLQSPGRPEVRTMEEVPAGIGVLAIAFPSADVETAAPPR